ncbi:BTAD domain-containing putative transcriptional regulator [Streptomonospora algeriensis]|uniref:BTAD domain-containing putative transcriptional regulator n=1 Tax=Streptomonospora algeriensis TaxID=995084 RepID=A0ABW3BB86_9ACTN
MLDPRAHGVRFFVLGELKVVGRGYDFTPSAPRLRQMLGLLLVRENQVVTLESIISEMWCDNPPRTAVATVQTYIYQLRRGILGNEDSLVTRKGGYTLSVDPGALDVHLFERLADEGEELLQQGRAREASAAFARALELWEGDPLTDTPRGHILDGYIAVLQERRTQVLMQRIRAEMISGDEHRLIRELRRCVEFDPYNEWYHEQLIKALIRTGRRREAAQSYERLVRLLDDELSIPPSCSVRQLFAENLGGAAI